ncbi:MAG: GNAT family N-acetyltransferase [Rhizobiales bacterium]|nr:GNAT family N-acetyltransferase [Hyphomicrobiales bacterium]
MSEIAFGSGFIRKLWAHEKSRFEAHLLRLDLEGRRLRFGHSVSNAFLREYAASLSDTSGVTYGYFEDGELRAVAELRKLGIAWGKEAEGAFSVETAWRGHGIGTELMGRVIRAARNRGVAHLYVTCLADNIAMQKVARKHDAVLRFEYGDVIGDIVPTTPSYISLFEEAIEDQHAFMVAVLDIQSRIVNAA